MREKGKLVGQSRRSNSPQITGVPEREKRENEGKEIITKCFKRISPN